jgi:hypothetical protein
MVPLFHLKKPKHNRATAKQAQAEKIIFFMAFPSFAQHYAP